MEKTGEKLPYMDGLRGLAAFVVVLHHFVLGFAEPFARVSAGMSQIEKVAYAVPIGLLIVAGDFAVSIFFVISGFVLSQKFFVTGRREVVASGAIRRYFRLMPTVLAAVLLSYLILATGHYYNIPAAKITGSAHWLATSWIGPAHFWVALKLALFDAYFTGQHYLTYDNVLWTMQIEFLGSMLVFAFLALAGKLRHRWAVYAVLGLLFSNTYYMAFVLGMALSDLAVLKRPTQHRLVHPAIAFLTLLVGLAMGLDPQPIIGVHAVGAAMILGSILVTPKLRSLLGVRPVKYLGRVSFALYLVHLSVLASVGCVVFLWAYPHIGYVPSVLAAFVVSMILTFPLAELITRYIDIPAVRLTGKIYQGLRAKAHFGHRSASAVGAPSAARS